MLKNKIFLLILAVLLSVSHAWAGTEPASQGSILTITVEKESTLDDLILASGYGIDDEDIEAFLALFMEINPDVNSLSYLSAGTVVHLPVMLLNTNSAGPVPVTEEPEPVGYAAAESAAPSDLQAQSRAAVVPTEKTGMRRFSDREEAEAFLGKLIESGYTGSIEQQKDSRGQIEYQVYALLPGMYMGDEGPKSLTWSLLGTRGKNIHAALTLSGIFTDNAFNSREDRKSGFSVILTPEIWLNLPRTDRAVSYGGLYPRTAGGHLLAPLVGERLFGYQTSLHYQTELPLVSSKNSPRSSTPTHRIAAGLDLVGNRLSLNLANQFEKSFYGHEAGQFININTRQRYDANRFSAGVAYNTRNRILLSIDYINFITKNRNGNGESLDRHDHGFTPAVRYRLSQKISLLAEYSYYNISYDDFGALDSKEHYLMGGVEWRLTEKSFGRIKAGYASKKFRSIGRHKGISLELQVEHRLRAKTQLIFSAYRRTNERMVADTAFVVSTGARLTLSHMITSKITGAIKLAYVNDLHKGPHLASLSETVISDNTYQAGIELQYAFRRWLSARAEYLFTIKDSSDPAFDYRSNTFLLGITGKF